MMSRKDFFIGLIFGIIIFSLVVMSQVYGQDKSDSTTVWMKKEDIKIIFQTKLDEENKRHEREVLFIQGQLSVCEAFADSVKVKK